ncbi:hypothetical protein ACOSQ3_001869 [Xanthoceras sorbifolium]
MDCTQWSIFELWVDKKGRFEDSFVTVYILSLGSTAGDVPTPSKCIDFYQIAQKLVFRSCQVLNIHPTGFRFVQEQTASDLGSVNDRGPQNSG